MNSKPPSLDLDPQSLPPGTRIGSWLVEAFRGRGVFGAVYKAVHVTRALPYPVALKIAVHPRDPRFEREVGGLSRVHHPNIPFLIDSGQWRHSSGFLHPFIVMQWVDGEPLYSWAARRNPSSRQVLRLLAQAARALQATHSAGAVHRDVKGGNVLVRPADGHLFLTDFGSCHYQGVERLTPSPLPPGTPAYNSPEVWDFARLYGHLPFSLYVARPSDDVFAFGVMAYRLVTDQYPPFSDSSRHEGRCWKPGASGPQPPRALNPRVDPGLDALISRALSLKPENRGSAQKLAQALERRTEKAGPDVDAPLFDWETQERAAWSPEERAEALMREHRPRRRDRQEVDSTLLADAALQVEAERRKPDSSTQDAAPVSHALPRARHRSWRPWLAAAALAALMLWPQGTGPSSLGLCSSQQSSTQQGPTSLGDTTLASSRSSEKSPTNRAVAVEVPPQPLPGQIKPASNGLCSTGLTAINGGCWVKADVPLDACKSKVTWVVYRGGCYIPMFPPGREPTSTPIK